jgi:hypothetical protein
VPEWSLERAGLGEKRAPICIILDRKKRILDFMIVFMEIQALTEFGGELDASFPGVNSTRARESRLKAGCSQDWLPHTEFSGETLEGFVPL